MPAFKLPHTDTYVDWNDKRAVWWREKFALEARIKKTGSDKKREQYEAILHDLKTHPPEGV